MSEYVSKSKSLQANVITELHFSNCPSKGHLKNKTRVDALDFAKKN